ncbi:MAG: 5-oxoprolinase subunit PxpA [Bacteroidota bacterium]
MKTIDLNCDLGESYGKSCSSYDAEIMPWITSCNIACGFHSGDPSTLWNTIQLALTHNVAIGAHPGYPDLQGFGRRVMDLSAQELFTSVLYQVSALKGMVEAAGGKLHHVKPHGALYNRAAEDEKTSRAILEAVHSIHPGLPVYLMPHSVTEHVATSMGVPFLDEGFADRRYTSNYRLQSRKEEGAVLHSEEDVKAQLSLFLKGQVYTAEGESLPIAIQTLCLHSDTPSAVKLAETIHHFFRNHHVEIKSAR